MSFWKQLFRKGRPASAVREASEVEPGDPAPLCLFCAAQEGITGSTGPYGYPLWECPCGAIGSGAWPADLDEVADQLLGALRIQRSVSEPLVPTDNPAISLQRYDADKVRREFHDLVHAAGYELRCRITETRAGTEEEFWVKRTEATG